MTFANPFTPRPDVERFSDPFFQKCFRFRMPCAYNFAPCVGPVTHYKYI